YVFLNTELKKTISLESIKGTMFRKKTGPQLVNEADVVISGTVISQEVQSDFEGFPVTDTIVKVNNVYKGDPGQTVEIRVNGGETAEMIYILDEEAAPAFHVGEEVLVFLTGNKGLRPDKNDFGYFWWDRPKESLILEPTLKALLKITQIRTALI
ncbi:hypothetical protein RB298_28945, partial [Priestia sp. BR_2]